MGRTEKIQTISCSAVMQCLLPQVTGKLKIGTYTGPLQHGIVYSGGEARTLRGVTLMCSCGLQPP